MKLLLIKTNKSHLIYMNKERFRKLFKRLRDFILCCKKTVDEVNSVLEDINELQLFHEPKEVEVEVEVKKNTI